MARESSITVSISEESHGRLLKALEEAADNASQADLCVLLQCYLNLHGWVPLLRALKTVAERGSSWSVAKSCEALIGLHSIPDEAAPPPTIDPLSNQARDTK